MPTNRAESCSRLVTRMEPRSASGRRRGHPTGNGRCSTTTVSATEHRGAPSTGPDLTDAAFRSWPQEPASTSIQDAQAPDSFPDGECRLLVERRRVAPGEPGERRPTEPRPRSAPRRPSGPQDLDASWSPDGTPHRLPPLRQLSIIVPSAYPGAVPNVDPAESAPPEVTLWARCAKASPGQRESRPAQLDPRVSVATRRPFCCRP